MGVEPGRVLIALHNPLLNGATISVLRTVPLLERRGWKFSFWVPGPGPALDHLRERGSVVDGVPTPIVSGLQPLRLPPGPLRRIAATPPYLRRFRRYLHRVDPDVVHANSLYAYAEVLAARAAGFPTVFHIHDMAPPNWKAKVARMIARYRADVAVAVSAACAASYRANGWAPRVVYESAPLPPEPAPTREHPRPFVVGSVGIISRRKGSDVFVEAARRVKEQTDAIEFRLIGSPTDPLEREWAQSLVRRAGEAGIVHAYEANVMTELRGWDAFVLPSRYRDPCPLVMLEAMATGLPVIGTRVGGIPEQITSQCGLLVEPDDPAALATAIKWMAEQPAPARAAMGAAGRARVESKFSVDVQAHEMHRAYLAAMSAARSDR